jgi:hypothetical protein
MRRLILTSAAFLSACATAPQPSANVPQQIPAQPQIRRGLIGLSASELIGHLGNPALQIREGSSVKLQFRGRSCVLDAYLYPVANGGLHVTHVDTRTPSGIDFDQAACIASLEHPS